MKGVPAMYLGRIVDKKHFRAFIYDLTSQTKLVESWGDFESHMQTGIWFATKEEAILKPAVKQKFEKKNKSVVVNDSIEDDFLPSEAHE